MRLQFWLFPPGHVKIVKKSGKNLAKNIAFWGNFEFVWDKHQSDKINANQ